MARPDQTSSSAQIEIVQLYRAIAAIAVMAYHEYIFSMTFLSARAPEWFRTIFDHGYYGVDFFFVLSGFIILTAHRQDQDNTASLKRYALKRAIRIYPAYLPIAAVLLVIYSINPEIGIKSKDEISVISSVFLVPTFGVTALPAAWTLIHEIVFYTIFIMYFLWRKAFPVVIGLWALVMAANVLVSLELAGNPISAKIFNAINLEFIGGMICALVWRRLNAGTATGILLLLCGVLGLVGIVGADGVTGFSERCILTVPFALILLGGCCLEKGTGFRMPRPFVRLGDASYALYLVHGPLISVMFRAVPAINRHVGGLGPAAEWAVTVSLTTAVCILAALLYHTLYERPVLGFLRRKALHP